MVQMLLCNMFKCCCEHVVLLDCEMFRQICCMRQGCHEQQGPAGVDMTAFEFCYVTCYIAQCGGVVTDCCMHWGMP
jgi:hypothetical protein